MKGEQCMENQTNPAYIIIQLQNTNFSLEHMKNIVLSYLQFYEQPHIIHDNNKNSSLFAPTIVEQVADKLQQNLSDVVVISV